MDFHGLFNRKVTQSSALRWIGVNGGTQRRDVFSLSFLLIQIFYFSGWEDLAVRYARLLPDLFQNIHE